VVADIATLAGQRRLREGPEALPAEFVHHFYATLDRLDELCGDYRSGGATPILAPVTGPDPATLVVSAPG